MKRAHDIDIQYAVMETSDNNGIYVEFMPQFWLVSGQNGALKLRDRAQFYFPCRAKGQSRDAYLRFLKQAKFIGMKPQDEGKWELKIGRILKLDLGSIEEAISAEKYYSDYFSTTETENKIEVAAPPAQKKVMRKKKAVIKPVDKTAASSESEDDDRGVNTISNYNLQFASDDAHTLFTVDESNNILPVDIDMISSLLDESMFHTEENQNLNAASMKSSLIAQETFVDPSNESFMDLALPVITEERHPELVPQCESNDLEVCAPNVTCCKGHQKILNKIDYVQKKHSKEMGLIRQEMISNRNLLLQLLQVQSQSNEESVGNHDDDNTDDIQGGPAHVDMAEVDEFTTKYKEIFPIKDSDFLIHFNKLKLDQKFSDQLLTKLNKVKGLDETRTTRKILKELCDNRCLKDFTWLGNKKMKRFESLHLIVELITTIVKGKYPDCNALDILKQVVQQRVKSAKEAWEKMKNKVSSSNAEGQNSSMQTEDNNADKTIDSVINEKDVVNVAEKEVVNVAEKEVVVAGKSDDVGASGVMEENQTSG